MYKDIDMLHVVIDGLVGLVPPERRARLVNDLHRAYGYPVQTLNMLLDCNFVKLSLKST